MDSCLVVGDPRAAVFFNHALVVGHERAGGGRHPAVVAQRALLCLEEAVLCDVVVREGLAAVGLVARKCALGQGHWHAAAHAALQSGRGGSNSFSSPLLAQGRWLLGPLSDVCHPGKPGALHRQAPRCRLAAAAAAAAAAGAAVAVVVAVAPAAAAAAAAASAGAVVVVAPAAAGAVAVAGGDV